MESLDAAAPTEGLLKLIDWSHAPKGVSRRLLMQSAGGLYHIDVEQTASSHSRIPYNWSCEEAKFYRSTATTTQMMGDYCLLTGASGLQLLESQWAVFDTPSGKPFPGKLVERINNPQIQVACLAAPDTLITTSDTPTRLQVWQITKPN